MEINLEQFFPTTKTKLKKLIKIIEMDYDNQKELKRTLQYYFQEKQPENERQVKYHAKRYLDIKQEIVELNCVVKEGKHSNGISLTQEEFKRLKGC